MERELLDVRRRLIYVRSLANYLQQKGWEPDQRWRLGILLNALNEEVALLAEEVRELEAIS